MNTIAKPIVKNKFWIVERDGEKLATIQAIDEDGGYAVLDPAFPDDRCDGLGDLMGSLSGGSRFDDFGERFHEA